LKFNSKEEEKLSETKTKPFTITKLAVKEAYQLVKDNAGGAGIDRQTLNDFDLNLKDNLYKIWNRMSSGCYFPPPVKAVPIPKKTGGERILGVPTVADRIAQMVVKLEFEPCVESIFLPDSYGYRPNKSALDAIEVTRKRCWENSWLIEYDIKGLFDNIDHILLMKAVRKHTDNKWVLLYIERWLKAPMQLPDGTLQERKRGVPQGGVISCVLSNLFLHYVFDVWMSKNYPDVPWCRYADDAVIHCKTEQQAKQILVELERRYKACGLELHPGKTKIVYCKDSNRKGKYSDTKFDFLGYTFRCRKVKSKDGKIFMSFTPAVSVAAQKSMRAATKARRFYRRTDLELTDIAKMFNPVLIGWINYYGKYCCSELESVCRHFNKTLVAWARRKYKKLGRCRETAVRLLLGISRKDPTLFHHWKIGMVGVFV
jgi:RNA-directed DNA polymerase